MKIVQKFLLSYLSMFGLAPGVASPIASGIRKQTTFKKQAGLGVIASGAGGQILRRENSVFSLTKSTFESDEIVSHQMSTGTRHGLQATTGKVSALLSPGTYKSFMGSALRKDFVAGVTSGALVIVTAAVTTGASGTFTRSGGSYLTDGFKIGDVIRWVGWATTGVPNNTHNFWITGLTALVMTGTMIDGVAVGAKAAGDSVTATVVGKKTLTPLTGHTDDLYTVEEWYPDIAQSEQFPDAKLNQMSIDLPASGNAKLSMDFVGLSRNLNNVQQFTAPAVETTSAILAAVTGLLMVNGVQMATVTGLKIDVAEGVTADGPVVGSNFSPDLSRGFVKISGSFSAYFQDSSLTSLFQVETPIAIMAVLTADTTAASEFIAFTLSRVKLNGDAPDDGVKGIMRTFPFTAEFNLLGGAALANDQTIMSIQDSLA